MIVRGRRCAVPGTALAAFVLLVMSTMTAAAAQPGQAAPTATRSAVDRLAAAAIAIEDQDWDQVITLVGDIPGDPSISGADSAEAYRLLGIAEFYRRRYDSAEAHFHAYLRLDLDGQLDIGLHAPDVVQFFDSVKAKHAAELRALRPRTRRWAVLNFVPPAGQFQNRQAVKGWIFGGLGAALLATNIGSYVLLDRWCDDVDRTCESGSESRAGTARTLQQANAVAGIALIGLYVYGVVDGFRHYRRTARTRTTLTVTPGIGGFGAGSGGGIGLSGTF